MNDTENEIPEGPDWEDLNNKAIERATAKAEMVYLQEYRKCKKAEQAGVTAANAQEREAYRHEEYIIMLVKLHDAVETFELRDLELKLMFERIGVWRTKQSTQRAAMQAGG